MDKWVKVTSSENIIISIINSIVKMFTDRNLLDNHIGLLYVILAVIFIIAMIALYLVYVKINKSSSNFS